MENSMSERASVEDIQYRLDWYCRDAPGWDFLLEYPNHVLGDVALTLMEGRVERDNKPAMDFILSAWLESHHASPVKRARAFSIGCLQQAYSELERGDYVQAIVLAVYSDMYNQSGDVEWMWNMMPLAYDQLLKQDMKDKMDYVKHLCDMKNG